jgi:putative serine protease PepD
MMPRPNTVGLAVGAFLLAGLGALAGAALYAAFAPASTTTVAVPGGGGTPDSPAAPLSPATIYRLAAPGVVEITAVQTERNPYFGDQPQRVESIGTGFVYDRRGDIVTNDHVAGGAHSITVRFPDDETFKAHVVARDTDTDLAVIRVAVPSSLLHPLTLGDSDQAQIGEPVVAIGSPFGHVGTLTTGIVSDLHQQIDSPNGVPVDALQTDAPINPGNSGGPLLDAAGRVIGVNTQSASRSGNSNGVGFAIPSATVEIVAPQLVAGGPARHAYVGSKLGDSTSPPGAKLTEVVAGGPGAAAGLKTGDVVTRLDAVPVTSSEGVIGFTQSRKPGEAVTVTYIRGGTTHTARLELGTRPS